MIFIAADNSFVLAVNPLYKEPKGFTLALPRNSNSRQCKINLELPNEFFPMFPILRYCTFEIEISSSSPKKVVLSSSEPFRPKDRLPY